MMKGKELELCFLVMGKDSVVILKRMQFMGKENFIQVILKLFREFGAIFN